MKTRGELNGVVFFGVCVCVCALYIGHRPKAHTRNIMDVGMPASLSSLAVYSTRLRVPCGVRANFSNNQPKTRSQSHNSQSHPPLWPAPSISHAIICALLSFRFPFHSRRTRRVCVCGSWSAPAAHIAPGRLHIANNVRGVHVCGASYAHLLGNAPPLPKITHQRQTND